MRSRMQAPLAGIVAAALLLGSGSSSAQPQSPGGAPVALPPAVPVPPPTAQPATTAAPWTPTPATTYPPGYVPPPGYAPAVPAANTAPPAYAPPAYAPPGYGPPGYVPPPHPPVASPGYYPAPPYYSVAQADSAQPVGPPPGHHQHDGFFLRIGGGASYLRASNDTLGTKVSGYGVFIAAAVGGVVAKNLVLYGEIQTSVLPNPDIQRSQAGSSVQSDY